MKARKEKKVKLVWEELKNGGPFRKLYLVGAECLLIYCLVKDMYEKIVLHEDVPIILIVEYVVLVLAVGYGTKEYLKCRCRCLPVSRWLNVSELKKSLEKETFQKVAYKIWSSEKWLCVDGHYYPKNIIVYMGGWTSSTSRSGTKLKIRTILGEDIIEYGYYPIYQPDFGRNRGKLVDNYPMLDALIPLTEMIPDRAQKWNAYTSVRPSMKKMYEEYMKTHSVTELIETTELLDAYVAEFMRWEDLRHWKKSPKKYKKGTNLQRKNR